MTTLTWEQHMVKMEKAGEKAYEGIRRKGGSRHEAMLASNQAERNYRKARNFPGSRDSQGTQLENDQAIEKHELADKPMTVIKVTSSPIKYKRSPFGFNK